VHDDLSSDIYVLHMGYIYHLQDTFGKAKDPSLSAVIAKKLMLEIGNSDEMKEQLQASPSADRIRCSLAIAALVKVHLLDIT